MLEARRCGRYGGELRVPVVVVGWEGGDPDACSDVHVLISVEGGCCGCLY